MQRSRDVKIGQIGTCLVFIAFPLDANNLGTMLKVRKIPSIAFSNVPMCVQDELESVRRIPYIRKPRF